MTAPTYVQSGHVDNAAGSVTSIAYQFTSAQTAGNCNIVFVSHLDSQLITSVLDTKGNAYALIGSAHPYNATNNAWAYIMEVYVAANIVGASANSNTVTVNFSASANFQLIACAEYSGANAISPVDG